MRKNLLYLCSVAMSLCVPTINAQDFTVDDISYNILTDNTCEVAEDAYEGDIIIPETVEYDGDTYTVVAIGERAFEMTEVTTVEIPETVTSIGDWAFLDCWDLTEIIVPNSVTYLGFYCFGCCYSLESAVLSSSITVLDEELFRDCAELKSIVVPEGVVEIKEDAFYGCESLEEVTLPSTLRVFGEYVFAECKSLKHIAIPEGMTSLGYSCFQRAGLESISLPSTLEKIDAGAFYYCSGLKEIELPASVNWIGGSAFFGCTKLTKLTALSPSVIEFGSNNAAFSQTTYDNCTLYVPSDLLSSYKADEKWNKFANIEAISSSAVEDLIYENSDHEQLYDIRGVKVTNPTENNLYFSRKGKVLYR